MYVLIRTDGRYVADPSFDPRGGSYTRKLEHARTYLTHEAADKDRCSENERIVDVAALLNSPYGRTV